MKRLFIILVAVLFTACVFAQTPQLMSFQLVVRNSSGALVQNSNVGIRISILRDSTNGTVVYKEIYNPNPQTNINGLVRVEIGSGIPITGTFSGINWSNATYFIKTETDPAGGTNYTITGVTQLLSVPYALHSKTTETYTETDPLWTTASSNYYTITNMQTSGSSQLHFNNIINKPTTLVGYGIIDAMSTSHVANGITSIEIANWNTAFGWGNHAGLYRPINWVPDWSDLTNKPIFATIATSGSYNDLSNKPNIKDTVLTYANGSETKLTPGTNVTITGSGTIASPYVINSTGGGSPAHSVGDLYAGGVIFYVDQTGNHGLICSMIDLSSSQAWSNVTSTLIGATAQCDWNGQTNTNAIIGQSGHTNSAAKLCDDYVNVNYGTGVYSDWYLPSIDEFNLLYIAKLFVNKALDSDGNSATTTILKAYYWTSSEGNNINAWYFSFYLGPTGSASKANTNFVRAIRAF